MIQQIAVEQTISNQSSQTTAVKSTQNADTFQELIHSAVKATKKGEKTAETGEKAEKQGDRSKKDGTVDLLQTPVPLQAVFLPFRAAKPVETTEDLPVTSTGLPMSPSNVATALQANASAEIPLPTEKGTNQSVPQGITGAQAKSKSTVVPLPETENRVDSTLSAAKAPQTPAQDESNAAGNLPVQFASPAVSSSETEKTVSTGQASRSKTITTDGGTTDAEPRIRISAGNAAPERKEETSEKHDQTSAFSNLYTNGNVVIKVSDAKTVPKPQAVRQVAQAVLRQVKQGKQEIQVELYPKSLGKVSVKLSSENGILTVEIAATNPKTQSLLLSGSDDIRSILQSSTGQHVNMVRPEQTGSWYARQDGGGTGYRQQDQSEEKREAQTWHRARSVGTDSVGGMGAGDFISLMRQVVQ